jgi:hypothetical protein
VSRVTRVRRESNAANRRERQASRGRGTGALLLAAALLAASPHPAPDPEPPTYRTLMLDCARYRVEVQSNITIQSGRQRTRETVGRDGVMVLRASASDTLIRLEAWFDTLALWREGSGSRLVPDTDGLIGGRYRGTLNRLGGFTATDTPFMPDEVAEVADLSGVLGDLLPPLAPIPLKQGAGWRDDFGTVISRSEDGMIGGQRVERYRLIRRSTREESRVLPDSSVIGATRTESETGLYSWAGELGVMRWERDLSDQVRVPVGGLVKQPFTTGIEQKVTITRVGGGCE